MNPTPEINFDDFKKVEITVGKILSAEKVPETDKLLKLSVDFGVKATTTPQISPSPTTPSVGTDTPPQAGGEEAEEPKRDIRQIISGISAYFPDPQMLVGKKCMFVTNLEPRTIKGLESNGMLFAVSTEDGKFSLLEPNREIPEGTHAK
ncbi:MAG: hypothetical protein EXS51_02975 [Candidatus Taylorbacteria bacterium]|nr:hypothetical protein [Candidatus Taylorbacteria bacterium]